jgi:pyruvate,orthophosphate dikinase
MTAPTASRVAEPRIFAFDHPHAVPPRQLADELGGKGANLAEMTSVLGLAVPPGFSITTRACRQFRAGGWPSGLDEELGAALAHLEAAVGRRLGDPSDPLLLSVRSGARSSMPGMLDTVMNLGLTEEAAAGLARHVGDECAYDSFCRFLISYGTLVVGLAGNVFDEVPGDLAPKPRSAQLLERFERSAGASLPPAREQLRGAVEAVFRSWDGPRAQSYRAHEGIPADLGTAVNVQAMVFGNRDERSGTGVAFSRNPSTGENAPYGDFLMRAQGEDVVAGTAATRPLADLAHELPAVYAELTDTLHRLEAHYADLCDTEFTIESGRLWMLQTRIGKRSAAAAVRCAVEMAQQTGWAISRTDAVARVTAQDVEALRGPTASAEGAVIGRGLPASPGVGTGRVYFTADHALDAADRGEDVLLARIETSPDDVHGMQVAAGILTAHGGLVSHAAVVARDWGIPAVVGIDTMSFAGDILLLGALEVAEGTELTVDGVTGSVHLGGGTTAAPSGAVPELDLLLRWADDISGRRDPRSDVDRLIDAHRALDVVRAARAR